MHDVIKCYLGLDISKDKIDCCLLINKQVIHFIIENNDDGFNDLFLRLQTYQILLNELHVCCEATNIYYLGVAHFLRNQGAKMSVVNPAIIKYYAEYHLKRVKTDKQDAKLIAEFCSKENPDVWQPESSEQLKLKNLHRRVEQLQQMQTMEKKSFGGS